MNADLLVTLALAAHGNAALRARACGCGLRPAGASPLHSVGTFVADSEEDRANAEAWFDALRASGAQRLWVNVFQGAGEAHGWALEVARANGAEVWLARTQGPKFGFERVISQLPLSVRTPDLTEAHHRLNVALAEAHRQTIEARDAPLAASLLEARDCLEGAGPPEVQHILPDNGYGKAATSLFQAAHRISVLHTDVGGLESLVNQGVLGAALAAVNSAE